MTASRRTFLKGLAILSAGSGAAVTAAVASAEPHPDAALLALGTEIDAATARYDALAADLKRAVARFAEIEPALPDALQMTSFNGWVHTEWPPDALGIHSAKYGGNGSRVRMACPYHLERLVETTDGRTRAGRRARQIKKVSDAYLAAHDTARETAGTGRADRARFDQGRAIAKINVKVAAIPATTLAGLAVKARAELAWIKINRDEGGIREREGIVALFKNVAALGA